MATKKVKEKVITDVSPGQAQLAAEQFAAASNNLDKVEAKMNEELNRVRSKYQSEINMHAEAMREPYRVLSAYAYENRHQWEGKSIKMLHCIIGFRMGTRKVEKQKSFTWEAVLKLLKSFKNLKQFVRSKEEVNKEAILRISDEKLLTELKEKAFIEIVQDEQFFATTKAEEVTATA